jgi:hypothetical protein
MKYGEQENFEFFFLPMPQVIQKFMAYSQLIEFYYSR